MNSSTFKSKIISFNLVILDKKKRKYILFKRFKDIHDHIKYHIVIDKHPVVFIKKPFQN